MVFLVTKVLVVKVAVISIKKNYFVFDIGGVAYGRELVRGFNPNASINVPGFFVVDYPVQWEVEVFILGVLILLVHNCG